MQRQKLYLHGKDPNAGGEWVVEEKQSDMYKAEVSHVRHPIWKKLDSDFRRYDKEWRELCHITNNKLWN